MTTITFIVTTIWLNSFVNAFDPSAYPPPDKPPAINAEWTKSYMFNKSTSDSSNDITGCLETNQFALTFDDGPTVNTIAVLNALEAAKLKTTFFVVGSRILNNHQILLQAYNLGHEIAIHTWSHSDLTTLTNDQIVAEVVWTAKAIKDVIGVAPTVIRPPYGSIDNRVRSVLINMGLTVVNWNRDTYDWALSTADPSKTSGSPWKKTSTMNDIPALFQTWISQPMTGIISLQHDLTAAIVSIISPVLRVLQNSKYSVTSVSTCIGKMAYGEDLLNLADGLKVNNLTGENPTNTTIKKTTESSTLPSSFSTTISATVLPTQSSNTRRSESFQNRSLIILQICLALSFYLIA